MKNMQKLWLVAIIPLVFAACQPTQAPATPTPTLIKPEVILTSAVQTAEALNKQASELTPTATPAPPTPTPGLTQFTDTPTPGAQPTQETSTSVSTATPTLTATTKPAATAADNGAFTYIETIPDGSDFSPSAAFTKTWQFKNTGSTTWTTAYSLVYIDGPALSAKNSVPLPNEVAPNQTVDISVDMVAPSQPGSYKSYWRLINPSGQFFGDSVYVLIDVLGAGGATATLPAGSGASISNVTLSVDTISYSGTCPYTFKFAASFTVDSAGWVTYQLEAGGFNNLTLPDPVTGQLAPGTYNLNYKLEITASGSGWAQLHITAPVDVKSNLVNFSLTCQ